MSTRILRSGLRFGEGPRWHDGRLWYSDFYDHAVHAIDLDGDDERIVEVLSQRVPTQGGALDADRELHHTAESFKVAERKV